MALLNVLTDVRCWIASGVVCALLLGSAGEVTSTLLIAVLMVQMSLSMEGLTLHRDDVRENSRGILLATLSCLAVSTVSALLMGLLFKQAHPDVWKGWALLASAPCAVSVITFTLYHKGDMKLSVLSSVVIYLCALVFTPAMTLLFTGGAVNPLQVLKYVILFIAVPLAATYPLRKLRLGRSAKLIGINMMMFAMVTLAVGFNRDSFIAEPVLVLYIALASFVRIFLLSLVMFRLMQRAAVDRGRAVVYLGMAVWKNSGLAATLCILLLSSAPAALLPCVVSLLMETLWFGAMGGYFGRRWPDDDGDVEIVFNGV